MTRSSILSNFPDQLSLNVVEQWNGAIDFVFFVRRGEMTSNLREDHEIRMLALHFLQNFMVYPQIPIQF